MNIKAIKGLEILNSRGIPTVQCSILLENGQVAIASVPSGKSKGKFEAVEKRDGDRDRYEGRGVLCAISYIENVVAPQLVGQKPDIVSVDSLLKQLDGTENKSYLGANTTLSVSVCVARAASIVANTSLSAYLATVFENTSPCAPKPLFNVLNGGVHADNNLTFQEVLLVPMKKNTYPFIVEQAVRVYHFLGDILAAEGYRTTLGDEGGFAPVFLDATILPEEEATLLLKRAIVKSGVDPALFGIGFDVAASSFYDDKEDCYIVGQDVYSRDALFDFYISLDSQENIIFLEDGLQQDDWQGWSLMNEKFGDKMIVAGDDLLATNINRIELASKKNACNASIIKPNQIGTITETVQAINFCKKNSLATIASHRSGETCDPFIAELAYALSLDYIKAGAPARGERVAKYNKLLDLFQGGW